MSKEIDEKIEEAAENYADNTAAKSPSCGRIQDAIDDFSEGAHFGIQLERERMMRLEEMVKDYLVAEPGKNSEEKYNQLVRYFKANYFTAKYPEALGRKDENDKRA